MEWSKDEAEWEEHAQRLERERGWHLAQHPDLESQTVSYSLTFPRPIELRDLNLDDVKLILAKPWSDAAR